MNKFSASLNTAAFVNWPNGTSDEDHRKGDEDQKVDKDHKVDEDHKNGDKDHSKIIGSEITMGPLMKITKAKMIIIKGIVLLIWN